MQKQLIWLSWTGGGGAFFFQMRSLYLRSHGNGRIYLLGLQQRSATDQVA